MRHVFVILGIGALLGSVGVTFAQEKEGGRAKATAKITNDGCTIQIAQDGAFLNLPVVADDKDARRVTRVECQELKDDFCVAVLAELRHGQSNDYSYVLIVARAPHNPFPVKRDSKVAEIATKIAKFDRLTLENPESDTMKVRLDSPTNSAVKPVRYENGCARAWLYF